MSGDRVRSGMRNLDKQNSMFVTNNHNRIKLSQSEITLASLPLYPELFL